MGFIGSYRVLWGLSRDCRAHLGVILGFFLG